MCSLLQENLLGGKKESVSRSYVHVCWKKVMKMKRFNEKVYTGSHKVNLSCFREFDELERCLRYSDLKKFMVCACLILAGRLFQTSGALLVNESMPGREEGQNGRREFPLPLVWWECSVKLSLVHREREEPIFEHIFARQQQTGVPNDVRLTLNDDFSKWGQLIIINLKESQRGTSTRNFHGSGWLIIGWLVLYFSFVLFFCSHQRLCHFEALDRKGSPQNFNLCF